MDLFQFDDLIDRRAAAGRAYLEFQRSEDLSTGLYVLRAGAVDHQQPHTEDEIYVVMAGRAVVRVDDEDAPVGPGSVVFVPAGVPHRFHTIQEELRILVVFGPAEESRRTLNGPPNASDVTGRRGDGCRRGAEGRARVESRRRARRA